jgi:hypothetical protein
VASAGGKVTIPSAEPEAWRSRERASNFGALDFAPVVGILLALAVSAAAWLEQSALLLAVEAILALFVAAFIFWTRSRLRAKI